ncbi:hypothetical protein GCM10027034_19920 [Ramlibacter solisilvae]|uniref:HNH endonuclease n=1 Tax=Ramlibacter tataouinensis TaxID=94132 RepID=UPI0011AE5810|nr:HNH endonuclease [Ramlibacter tataouinensis]
MAKNLKKHRRCAFHAQSGRCFYCALPVWEEHPERFAQDQKVPTRLLGFLRNTAEHVVPRQDAGKDIRNNIVAACWWCNSQRHRGRQHRAPDYLNYRSWVQEMVTAGKWHPVVAHRIANQGQSPSADRKPKVA